MDHVQKRKQAVAREKLMKAVMDDVFRERLRQDAKWGLQRHENVGKWLAILGEEVGEVNTAAMPMLGLGTTKATDTDDLYEELIQVAAVAIAFAEQIKEGKGR